MGKRPRLVLIHDVVLRQQFQNTHIIGPARQLWLFMRVAQHQILGNKFNIGDPSGIGFDIKAIALLIAEMSARIFSRISRTSVCGVAPSRGVVRISRRIASKRACSAGSPYHHPGANQRLMLPGPGFIALIIGEGIGGGHQHARRAGWT